MHGTHTTLVPGGRYATRSAWLGPAFAAPARRIVSLVPSLTDALFMLGAGDALVGRTEFCVRPEKALAVPAFGGTKNCRVDEILALSPDVVLANKEENVRRRVEEIAERAPVLLTDPGAPHDAPALWEELGYITGRRDAARELAGEVTRLCGEMHAAAQTGPRPRVVYLVWKDPWMVAGHDTYISRLLAAAGIENALPGEYERFPQIEPGALLSIDADAMLYSTEPYAFELPRDLLEGPRDAIARGGGRFDIPDRPSAFLVDAVPLSWYPSQTAKGLAAAARLRDAIIAAELSGAGDAF
ncbi:helical backbone metal receptor [bacterium]|nr:helical backbone metal receptor [bacterium]